MAITAPTSTTATGPCALVDFFLDLHVPRIARARDGGDLEIEERVAFGAIVALSFEDPTGAGHLARALAGAIEARRLELRQTWDDLRALADYRALTSRTKTERGHVHYDLREGVLRRASGLGGEAAWFEVDGARAASVGRAWHEPPLEALAVAGDVPRLPAATVEPFDGLGEGEDGVGELADGVGDVLHSGVAGLGVPVAGVSVGGVGEVLRASDEIGHGSSPSVAGSGAGTPDATGRTVGGTTDAPARPSVVDAAVDGPAGDVASDPSPAVAPVSRLSGAVR